MQAQPDGCECIAIIQKMQIESYIVHNASSHNGFRYDYSFLLVTILKTIDFC